MNGQQSWGDHLGSSIALAFLAMTALTTAVLAQVAPTPDEINLGREVYDEFCQTYHGAGMVSSDAATFDLRRFPKDDAGRFRNAVLKGKGTAMPAFEGRLGEPDVDLLWAYVRGGL